MYNVGILNVTFDNQFIPERKNLTLKKIFIQKRTNK